MKKLVYLPLVILCLSCLDSSTRLHSRLKKAMDKEYVFDLELFESEIASIDLSQNTESNRKLVLYVLEKGPREAVKRLLDAGLGADFTDGEGVGILEIFLRSGRTTQLDLFFQKNPVDSIPETLYKNGYPLDFLYGNESLLEHLIQDENQEILNELADSGIVLKTDNKSIVLELEQAETLELMAKTGFKIFNAFSFTSSDILSSHPVRSLFIKTFDCTPAQMTRYFKAVESRSFAEYLHWSKDFYGLINEDSKYAEIHLGSMEASVLNEKFRTILGAWEYNRVGSGMEVEGPFKLPRIPFSEAELVIMFLKAGADPTAIYPSEYMGISEQWPFYWVARSQNRRLMKAAAELGAVPRPKDLKIAYDAGDYDLLMYLVKIGGKLNHAIVNSFGDGGYGYYHSEYILNLAVDAGNLELVKTLIAAGADLKVMSSLEQYIDGGSLEISKNSLAIAYVNAALEIPGAAEMYSYLWGLESGVEAEAIVKEIPVEFSWDYLDLTSENASRALAMYTQDIQWVSKHGEVFIKGTRQNLVSFWEEHGIAPDKVSQLKEWGIDAETFTWENISYQEYYKEFSYPLSFTKERYTVYSAGTPGP